MIATAFVIDATPQTANKLRRNRYWWTHTQTWERRIVSVVGHGPWWNGGASEKARRRVGVTVHRRRPQDPDNAVASMKPVLDALKRSGWIVDDSWTWLELHVWERVCQAGEERTEVVIEEVKR